MTYLAFFIGGFLWGGCIVFLVLTSQLGIDKEEN